VDGRHLRGGVRDEAEVVQPQRVGTRLNLGRQRSRGVRQPGPEPGQHRRADGAEAHRGGLDDEPGHHGGRGGKAEGQQQRGDDGSRRAESGSALDERSEEPGDDDHLDAPVRADRGEAGADRLQRTALRQGLEHEQRAEDDPEQADRDQQALHHGRADRHQRHLPREQGDDHDHREADGHRRPGGPAEPEQQGSHDEDREKGEQGKDAKVVHGDSSPATLPGRVRWNFACRNYHSTC
jgi:hypothetical protein